MEKDGVFYSVDFFDWYLEKCKILSYNFKYKNDNLFSQMK